MQRDYQPVTIERVRATHRARRKEIRERLAEFESFWRRGSDTRLWEELVFCIFTAGASARMGLRSVEALRHLLITGEREAMSEALISAGASFSNRAPRLCVVTRDYLREHCGMRLRKHCPALSIRMERVAGREQVQRALVTRVSHFLRNIRLKGCGYSTNVCVSG